MSSSPVQAIIHTNLKTVQASDSLKTAFLFLRETGIRHLPVVDSLSQVVGILTDSDLLRANVSSEPSHLKFAPSAKVKDFMSTKLKTVSINENLQDAVNLMLGEQVSCCLVEKNGEIIGIVTYEDLIRLLKDYLSSPGGSVRSALAKFISISPLGPVSFLLAKIPI